MSPVRRDIVAAVLLSAAVAAVSDLRPPTLEETTAFISGAVQRHQLAPPPRNDQERPAIVRAVFSACVAEKHTSAEWRELGRWEPRTHVTRWRLGDTDAASVEVVTETGAGSRDIHRVTLSCSGERACVDAGERGRTRGTTFEFTSDQIARRVAAAFRHAADLCHLPS